MTRRFGALLLAALALLPGCAAMFPRDVTVEERLAALPRDGLALERPVTVRWNRYLIPWISAETDGDLAFALGLVHGHLRGAQVALLRLVARGRLSEAGGPLALEVDHALRILDFGRAAPAVERNFRSETRAFVERFVAGLNHAVLHGPRPPEAGLLGLRREPFTVADVLAIGRLAGTDVNWLSLFSLLADRGQPGFRTLYQRTLEAGAGTLPAEGGDTAAVLGRLFAGLSRSGSNAVAVAPARSASGAALLASDPHLGLNLPNLWLVAGMRSPSYHAVGMMVPGLPILGLGRNPEVAWGGTNLRAASSDLFDVSALPREAFTEREVAIRQRLWFPARRRVRDTAYGPVVSDASMVPGGGALALRWVGHEPTDEITALLRAARARDGRAFGAAFANFGVSAQNMLWADRGGIGRLSAAVLPDRAGFPAYDPVLPATPEAAAPWARLRGARALPAQVNPSDGVLASANENPATWARDPPAIGWFFSDGDRVARLRALLLARPRLTLDELAATQTDTRAPRAAVLAAGLLARLDALPGGPPEPALLAELRGWDGDYREDSRAALVFELLLRRLVPLLLPEGRAGGQRGPETGWNFLTAFLLRDLDALPPERRAAVLRQAVAEAAIPARQYRSWGEVHRLRAAHWLVNLPVLGRRFVLGTYPVGGSRETPMKTGHGLVEGPHEVSFGSMARFATDLADPDSSRFTLFGGQDGWLGSAAFADQIPLWRERRHLRVPLRAETVAAEFPLVTRLEPGR